MFRAVIVFTAGGCHVIFLLFSFISSVPVFCKSCLGRDTSLLLIGMVLVSSVYDKPFFVHLWGDYFYFFISSV